MTIEDRLREAADPAYKEFHEKLIPTVDSDTVLGVRSPDVKKIAKLVKDTPEADSFIHHLPHSYFDENQLHMALIAEKAETAEEAIMLLDEFLPYVNNWSTCDSTIPKALRKDLSLVHDKALSWMESSDVYTKRYGINLAFKLFLERDTFRKDMMDKIARNGNEDYYIMMSSAWYWAEALNKQRNEALPYFTEMKLYPWIHDKALQKAIESRHFTAEEKYCFRSLKTRNQNA